MGIGTNILLLAGGAGLAFVVTKVRSGEGITIPLINIQLIGPKIPIIPDPIVDPIIEEGAEILAPIILT